MSIDYCKAYEFIIVGLSVLLRIFVSAREMIIHLGQEKLSFLSCKMCF